jgi:hypothetical protein
VVVQEGNGLQLELVKSKDSKKGTKASNKKCFVATAAFGDSNAPEVIYLSAFRDDSLSQSILGRTLIHSYYAVSPQLATIIAKSDFLRSVVVSSSYNR